MHGNHKAITVLGKLLNLQRCYFPVKQLCSTTLEGSGAVANLRGGNLIQAPSKTPTTPREVAPLFQNAVTKI